MSFSPSVVITDEAMDVIVSAGLTALPRETGGILVGFRSEDQVVVTRAVVVPDASSSRRSYRLRKRRAVDELAKLQADAHPIAGFVGDWHTHPADEPPSRTDITSLKQVAESARDLVALIVLPFNDGDPRPAHARIGCKLGPARSLRKAEVSIHNAVLTTTEITAQELEHSAGTVPQHEGDVGP